MAIPSVLLQVQTSPTAIIACCLSAAALLLAVFTLIRKEVREDGMTPAQRLKKAESTLREMDTRMTGFQQQHERTAERFADRCAALEKETAKVGQLTIDMATMQEQLKRLPDMERKIDNLTSLLTEFLARK